MTEASTPALRVAILADDLIWSTRLAGYVRAAGAEPLSAREVASFSVALDGARLAIVDLTARSYDGVDEVQRAAASGARVLAVGQHDDVQLRKRAMAAGAQRVFAYRKLFEDGPRTIETWLAAGASASGAGR